MSLISKLIPNLLNGVSQQAPTLRSDSQANDQINMLSSLSDGLHKRQPAEHIAKLSATDDLAAYHMIDRADGRFFVRVTSGGLKVFDEFGVEQTVSFPDGSVGYLTAENPETAFKLLSIRGYTFVLNREVKPQLAVSPYLGTDQISLGISFGDGTLGEPYVWPKAPGGYFAVQYKSGFTSVGNPQGWNVLPGPYTSLASAITAFYTNIALQGSSISGTWSPKMRITKVSGNPDYDNNPNNASIDFGLGISITSNNSINVPFDNVLQLTNPGISGGAPFDPQLRIYWRKSAAHGDSANSLVNIRPDVGWPDDPYKIPGETYQDAIMPVFDGLLFVSVNGTIFSISNQPGWTADQYAAYFAGQISTAFPSYTVTVDHELISIVGPAGERIFVRAWDSNNRGYVKVSYAQIPREEAIYAVIKQGLPNTDYNLSIDGTLFTYTTDDTAGDPNSWKVSQIAFELTALINADGDYSAANYGSFIKIVRNDAAAMTFAYHDSVGDIAMYAMKNKLRSIGDLPAKFIPGHPIEVVGTDDVGGYYLHYVQDGTTTIKARGLDNQIQKPRQLGLIQTPGATWNEAEGVDTGVWQECALPTALDTLIPYTMPHVLIQEDDGTFTFKFVDWFKREAGDDDSVPPPSFNDKYVNDLFFLRNRLGFLTDDTIVFSRSSEFFNFWPDTAKDVIDSDPIDVQVTGTEGGELKHAITFDKDLLVFGDGLQYVVSSSALLTPKQISVQPSTKYEVATDLYPQGGGRTVFFGYRSTGFTQLQEYYLTNDVKTNGARLATGHVPNYLPKGIKKLAVSPSLSMLAAVDGSSTLFVYKFLKGNQDEGMLQESWSRWQFSGEVRHVVFTSDLMYCFVKYDDGIYLEVINFERKRTDGDLGFLVHVDRKTSLTPTLVDDKMHITRPYPMSDLTLVDKTTGWTLPYEVSGPDLVFDPVEGDVLVGKSYEMVYELSPIYVREAKTLAIVDGRLVVKTIGFNYLATTEFTIKSTVKYRSEKSNQFLAKQTGNYELGAVQTADGFYRVPIAGEGPTNVIKLYSNTVYPTFIQSAVWEGTFVMTSRRSG